MRSLLCGQCHVEHYFKGQEERLTQHPEFEMWNQGVHAQAGVACADCYMLYMRVGGLKISDHHVQSPLLNINHGCQTCHKASEEELKSRAEGIQEKTFELRNRAMDALIALIDDVKVARESGASDGTLKEPRERQHKAQFLLDFTEAEDSMGFHAPQEAARAAATSIDWSRKGQVSLLRAQRQ